MGWFSSSTPSSVDNSPSSSTTGDSNFLNDDAASVQSPSFAGASLGTGPTATLKMRLQQEQAVANSQELLAGINTHCFEHCVLRPSSSLTKAEQACNKACTEKFMETWNATSRAYIARLQQERQQRGIGAL